MFEVHGAIKSVYESIGQQTSQLGFPVSDEYADPNSVHRRSDFEGGSIAWDPSIGGYRAYPTMVSPIRGAFKVTQEYSEGVHWGIDIGQRSLEAYNIYAAAEGVVDVDGVRPPGDDSYNGDPTYGGAGNFVVIKHKPGPRNICGGYSKATVYTEYFHLSEVYVEEGQKIEPGQLVGRMGDTGNATGVHLHFEVREDLRKEENAINPRSYVSFGDGGDPIPSCAS